MNKQDMMNQFRSMCYGTRIDDAVIDELEKMGYFEAPASKGHHLACPGGLAMHSMGVARRLRTLTTHMNLLWDRSDSPEVIGLLHDLCKFDQYIPHRNTVVMTDGMEANSFGGDDVSYTYNDRQLIAGHGDKSVMLIAPLLQLTVEEVMCIRYHMGAFSDDPKERSAYSDAVKMFPNVLWTHTADMWSSQIDNC